MKNNNRRLWIRGFIFLGLLVWAISSLYPLKDRPIHAYLKTLNATNPKQWQQLLQQAEERFANKQAISFPFALQGVIKENQVNLSSLFPQFNLGDLKSINKGNELILNELLRRSKASLKLGLDLKGGVAFTLAIAPESFKEKENLSKDLSLNKAIEIISRRINGLGITEPLIRARGQNQIEIQLPGISTQENPDVLSALKKPAKLEFKLLHPSFIPEKEARVPTGYELLPFVQEDDASDKEPTMAYLKKIPSLTGSAIQQAFVSMNDYGAYEIGLTFTAKGTQQFAELTRKSINQRLGIVLDNKLYSAPVIKNEITQGRASISGNFSQREALELVNVLNNPLELELQLTEMNEIGPFLAEDVLSSSWNATLWAAILVFAFMVVYYQTAGIIACISVGLNIIFVLAIMANIQATLTLPGIAALVLTLGMGVDANILLYERMREELKRGHSLALAIQVGYQRILSTILDANLTSLMVAFILIWMGSGPIKGFGVTLAIGILFTLVCIFFVTRFLIEWILHFRIQDLFYNFKSKRSFNFDFFKQFKRIFYVSMGFLLASIWAFFQKGDKIYGIDFTGGEEMIFRFDKKLALQDIYHVAQKHKLPQVLASYQKRWGENREDLKIQTTEGQGEFLLQELKTAFPEAQLTLEGKNNIGASVSSQLRNNALCAIGLSLLGILLYIAFRFEIGYGIGALISTAHDVLITIGIYILLGGQFSTAMVASILMIIGYSLNDTIVIFDRIREELKLNPQLSLKKVINLAINKTLSRTLITSLTTFFAVFALYTLGTGIIRDFSLIFMIGIIIGTISSIFIATPIFYWWHKGDRSRVAQNKNVVHHDWSTGV